MFRPEHYSARAFELETAAARVSDPNIRASYLELALGFRKMANFASLGGNSKTGDVVHLPERVVGRITAGT